MQPSSVFGLEYAVNSIAMPIIGGTATWIGPLVGAILLGTLQQVATVTISSAVNVLIVGLLLVTFVIVAPNGIVGVVQNACSEEVMSAPLLEVTGLGKRFGGFVALDGIDLTVAPGERVGLIGPNGSGKSTLVNCLCGTLTNEIGNVKFDGNNLAGLAAHQRTRLGMARSFQLPRPFVSMTIADNIRVPLIYAVNARSRDTSVGKRHRARAATNCSVSSGWPTARGSFRATSPRSTCASSNSRARWRPNRSC